MAAIIYCENSRNHNYTVLIMYSNKVVDDVYNVSYYNFFFVTFKRYLSIIL